MLQRYRIYESYLGILISTEKNPSSSDLSKDKSKIIISTYITVSSSQTRVFS